MSSSNYARTSPPPTDRITRSQAQTPPPPSPKPNGTTNMSSPHSPTKKTSTTMKQTSPHRPPYPSYTYTTKGITDTSLLNLPSEDITALVLLTLLAFGVRLFRIYQPTSVVFDEVHFGGFASKYIKGKFFMDVHPPLAKLLITLAGWLAGFDGEFDFKDIGKDYLEPGVPYVAMRLFPAVCGVLVAPVMFLCLKATGCRSFTAAMGSLLVIFENGLVTQSRLILLDSPLVIFTALTALSWLSFTNQHELGPSKAFTPTWWFWLTSTGIFLGATVSVKWVGLFTIAWVGSLTALQLWILLGDTRNVPARLWFKHLFARVFCLIIIPASFYMALFAIHFLCLVNPGEGDGFMSSEFQSTLNTKGMADVPADVAFGSRVSLRHHNTQGGYLHSHPHMYPEGSKQQQITLYPHKDENNLWLLENQTQPIDFASGDWSGNTTIPGPYAWDLANLNPNPEAGLDAEETGAGGIKYIRDGDIIKLYHIVTDRRLHSHEMRPPVTEAEWQNEVSAYGYEGFEGDANDFFRVEILPSYTSGSAVAKTRLRTIESKFRLVHVMTGCVLFSHKVKLPDWGFEQQEVTCAKGGTVPNSVWYVEQNSHPILTALETEATNTPGPAVVEKVNYRNPGFLGKFLELQKVMWTTNAGLIEAHAWDSRPGSWPLLSRGINFWGTTYRQIYLIGNPLIWWSSTAAVGVYLLMKALAVLRWQRSCNDYEHVVFRRADYEVGVSVLGWGFHYLPFFLMQRQLFLHHYFPALFFALMALCQAFDFAVFRFRSYRVPELGVSVPGLAKIPAAGMVMGTLFLALSVVVFWLLQPLAYGNQWTKSECERVQRWGPGGKGWEAFGLGASGDGVVGSYGGGWDWDCATFPDTYDAYASLSLSASATGNRPGAAAATSQAEHGPPPPVADNPSSDVHLTHLQPPSSVILKPGEQFTEERIEYRDENGRLLGPEEVENLKNGGGVKFETKYETRTRVVDEMGREVSNELVGQGEGAALANEANVVKDTTVGHGGGKEEAGTVVDAPEPMTVVRDEL